MITRFTVQNFKSLINVTVELSPVTVLVGRSGVGKSNFVGAIRCLRDFLRGTGELAQQWNLYRPAMTPTGVLAFDVEFTLTGVELLFRYRLAIGEHGPGHPLKEELLMLGEETLFHQVNAKWQVAPRIVGAPKPGHSVLGQLPSISEAVYAYAAFTTGIGCYEFPQSVLSTSGQIQTNMSGLADDARNYLETLKDITANLQDIGLRKSLTATLRRLNSTIASVELNSILQPQHVVVGHEFDGKTLPLILAQESDGFRRFYAHLLALYQRPPKQTMVFEEPENGIYPGALSLLADEFKVAPAGGRGQVILTTHSPGLLDHFSPEQIRVVELAGFETQIGSVSSEQQQALKEKLLEAGELLTVDPARLATEQPKAAAV